MGRMALRRCSSSSRNRTRPSTPAVYKDIQQSIEVFHTQFAQSQTELVSRKQEYQNLLTGTTSGRFYNMLAHYPHIDMSKYDIVTSAKTEQDFDTKQAGPLDVFGHDKK